MTTIALSPVRGNYLHRPTHPNASKGNGNVGEHIWVMSQVLGRALRKGETVHHRNGIRADNRPENLELRTHIHPAGQSIEDMLNFCEWYVSEYGHLKGISTQQEEAAS